MGPLEQVKPWNTRSATGVYKFLNRVWNLIIGEDGVVRKNIEEDPASETQVQPINKAMHRLIKKVTEDIDQMKFHTAIASLMAFCNEAGEQKTLPKPVIMNFVLLLSPFAPHIAEELWQRLGSDKSLAYESWPVFDPELARHDVITIAVQVNGKLRDTLDVDADIAQRDLIDLAKRSDKIAQFITGKEIRREIVVPKRLVNLVVN
jgi:leucyl-tRNA synthetase